MGTITETPPSASGYWNSIQWTPEMTTLLVERRAQRWSAERIGKEFGISDRAVKSQLSRMGMPTTLPPLKQPEPEPRPIVQLMRQATLPLPQPVPFAAPKTCQWPLWGNERPGLNPRFCGARAQLGRPYCRDHYIRSCAPRSTLECA